MCVNYAPVQRQVLRDVFGVEPPPAEWRAEAWPDYLAPIVRADENGKREAVMGSFSMVPKAKIPPGVRYCQRQSKFARLGRPKLAKSQANVPALIVRHSIDGYPCRAVVLA